MDMNDTPVDSDFPVAGLLPKKETGVLAFLNKYPEYDGTGTVIAILDSGIDPGAPGLKVTTDGRPKIIERFDCSGCGDVTTTTITTPTDGIITGLTGREIKIPNNWVNPQGTYRLGVKHAFDLYPDRLRDRMKQIYKKASWDNGHRKNVADISRQLAEFDLKHSTTTLSEMDKLTKENLDAKMELLTSYEKKFSDAGPVYDCILFHDGTKWLCCINTSEDGDVSKCPLLGEYSITHEYAPLTEADKLNVSINVHNNGNLLEIVGVCSSHGTHVASIASGYFPGNPEQNGIASGAQIVSLSIGDGRLGSMETGTALVRAMIKIMELEKTTSVHVINMSYGEHAHWLDAGRLGELMNDVISKYGVVWVASAGNNGPALGTISTPSDLNQEPIISVGAYVSPDMMIAEYAMSQKIPGMPYTWSSRGPTLDGGIGVHICAPGGAITSVPNFTLRYSQLMNGTSMASPHVAGAVALLISGMLQKSIPYTPYNIKRALENTASFIPGVEHQAQGSGLVQIDKAYEYLLNYYNVDERIVRFQIRCGPLNSCANMKGIYIRSQIINHKHSFQVIVDPHFLDSDNVPADVKINFNMKLALTCNASYVTHPSHLDLSNLARLFAVHIDTSALAPGLHSTFVNAYDVKCLEKGPVFRIPVTVIKPIELEKNKTTIENKSIFKCNTILRQYILVNECTTWGVLKMRAESENSRFVVHTLQALPRQCCKTLETNKTLEVNSTSTTTHAFQVRGSVVLEIVIAKYWANCEDINLNYTLSFHGVKPSQPCITMHPADGVHSMDVRSLIGEEISPTITLKNSVQILKPSEGKVTPLTERDLIPPSKQIYELVLVYNFSLTKQCEVSPNFALLSHTLYECEFESQLWLLFDSNKQLLGCGDAYPSKYTIKLEKGEYVIRLQVRHDKKENLDKLVETPMLLQQKLSNSIVLDVHMSHAQALVGTKKPGASCFTAPNAIVPLYIAPLSSEKFSLKSNNPAHYLTGVVTYVKDDIGKKVDTYPVKYFLPDTSNPVKKSVILPVTPSEKTKVEEMTDAVRDLKIQWFPKLDAANAVSLYEELLASYPDHLQLHSAYLQVIDPLDKRILPTLKGNGTVKEADLNKVISTCTTVISSINDAFVLAHIATKIDSRPDAAKFKTQMDQQKNILVECYSRKGIALCRFQSAFSHSSGDSATMENISTAWKNLLKYVDPNDAKVFTNHVLYFAIWHSFVHKQYGRLMKYLNKLQEDKPTKDTEERLIEFAKLLHWDHVVAHLKRGLPSKFPLAYRPF